MQAVIVGESREKYCEREMEKKERGRWRREKEREREGGREKEINFYLLQRLIDNI